MTTYLHLVDNMLPIVTTYLHLVDNMLHLRLLDNIIITPVVTTYQHLLDNILHLQWLRTCASQPTWRGCGLQPSSSWFSRSSATVGQAWRGCQGAAMQHVSGSPPGGATGSNTHTHTMPFTSQPKDSVLNQLRYSLIWIILASHQTKLLNQIYVV